MLSTPFGIIGILTQFVAAREWRLAGVVGVSAFLSSSEKEQRSQAELALSNALAIEDSELVRNAITSSFKNMRAERAELESTVLLLVEVSRGLMREGLWSNRSPIIPPDASPQARAAHVGESIIALMRKGARPNDLSYIYLAWCNLRGMSLPGVDFDDSILAGCDFSGANLTGASFNGTDLAGARFEEADLRKAHLVNTTPFKAAVQITCSEVLNQSFSRLNSRP